MWKDRYWIDSELGIFQVSVKGNHPWGQYLQEIQQILAIVAISGLELSKMI